MIAAGEKRRRIVGIALLCGGSVLLAVLPFGLQVMRLTGYHARPHPEGMRLRVELPASVSRFRAPDVRVRTSGEPVLDVHGLVGGPHAFSIASGVPLAASSLVTDSTLADPGAFDFDGDGVEDEIVDLGVRGGNSVLRVVSGSTGRTLFQDSDAAAYTPTDRGRALPDLDGDGLSELALYHPRDDRATYDFEPVDLLLDAKSWLTVVSYDGR
ncbi:MAG: hypothetical protein AAGI22_21510 [Planctomycetota bacterium]